MRLFVAVRWKADPHMAEPNWIEKEIKWSLMGQIFVQRPAWCTSGMLSICSSFRLLRGPFLEVSAELTAGLEAQRTNEELPQPGAFLCIKSFGR